MASTNAFLTMYNTAQANSSGSTIVTGFIPYISTGGKQVYTSTLTTLTFSTVNCSSITATSGLTFSTVNCSSITATSGLNLSVPTGQGITFQVGGSTIGTVTSSGFPGGGMTGTATIILSSNLSGAGTYYGSGTYSVAGYKYVWIRLVGGGAGGGANGGGATTAGSSSSVTYYANTALNMTCGGGVSGTGGGAGTGGTASGGNIINIPGGNSYGNMPFTQQSYVPGIPGTHSMLGQGGMGGNPNYNYVPTAGTNGSGGGGAGVYWAGGTWGYTGLGGAAGGYAESIIINPSGNVYVTIGQGGLATYAGAGGHGCCIIIGFS